MLPTLSHDLYVVGRWGGLVYCVLICLPSFLHCLLLPVQVGAAVSLGQLVDVMVLESHQGKLSLSRKSVQLLDRGQVPSGGAGAGVGVLRPSTPPASEQTPPGRGGAGQGVGAPGPMGRGGMGGRGGRGQGGWGPAGR